MSNQFKITTNAICQFNITNNALQLIITDNAKSKKTIDESQPLIFILSIIKEIRIQSKQINLLKEKVLNFLSSDDGDLTLDSYYYELEKGLRGAATISVTNLINDEVTLFEITRLKLLINKITTLECHRRKIPGVDYKKRKNKKEKRDITSGYKENPSEITTRYSKIRTIINYPISFDISCTDAVLQKPENMVEGLYVTIGQLSFYCQDNIYGFGELMCRIKRSIDNYSEKGRNYISAPDNEYQYDLVIDRHNVGEIRLLLNDQPIASFFIGHVDLFLCTLRSAFQLPIITTVAEIEMHQLIHRYKESMQAKTTLPTLQSVNADYVEKPLKDLIDFGDYQVLLSGNNIVEYTKLYSTLSTIFSSVIVESPCISVYVNNTLIRSVYPAININNSNHKKGLLLLLELIHTRILKGL